MTLALRTDLDTNHPVTEVHVAPGEYFYRCDACGGPARIGDGAAAVLTDHPDAARGMGSRPFLHDLKSDFYWQGRG